MKLKKVSIRNFKSIKNVELDFNNLIVLLGKNGVGKTNILEFFKFIKIMQTNTQLTQNPLAPWWGYKNLVWNKDESLAVGGTFYFEKNELIIIYEVNYGILPNTLFGIINEKIEIENELILNRIGNEIFIEHSKNNINKWKEVQSSFTHLENGDLGKIGEKISKTQKITIQPDQIRQSILFGGYGYSTTFYDNYCISQIDFQNTDPVYVFTKSFTSSFPGFNKESLLGINRDINSFILNTNYIRYPNLIKMRQTIYPTNNLTLTEDGSNLIEILYHWYIAKDPRIKTIESIIQVNFPLTEIIFGITEDGRIYMSVLEEGLEFKPQSISDGLYRLLFILVNILVNPSLLLIDEIENSLHASNIELILDELKDTNFTSIISTHSPLIVDLLDLNHLVILVKENHETAIYKPQKIPELKKKMKQLGLSHSDAWLEGVFEGVDN